MNLALVRQLSNPVWRAWKPSCSTSNSNLIRTFSNAVKTEQTEINPKLHRGPGERDITNMDLIEERIRQSQKSRELKIGDQIVHWNYRSEIVDARDLNKDHRFIWIGYFFLIIIGFGAFVVVKSQVVNNRREDMLKRRELKKQLLEQQEKLKTAAQVEQNVQAN
ncbi:hypothetical protein WR25_19690 [Diploscapter pachys]|uniref:Uncharacterized protein n=1 Tax=Diploscapter pachys TaxID=2018661 RepID=A0A2A2JVP0_9BILA|nr:hypothetical protein WR25_19690 [Diploscapter pachys]